MKFQDGYPESRTYSRRRTSQAFVELGARLAKHSEIHLPAPTNITLNGRGGSFPSFHVARLLEPDDQYSLSQAAC